VKLAAEYELTEDQEQDPEFRPDALIPGYHTRFARNGAFRVVELDIEADPAKRDPEFVDSLRRLFPSDNDFRREIRRDWSAGAGDMYFPEYVYNGGHKKYVHPVSAIKKGTIYRAFDFGIRAPAAVWFQYSAAQKRVWVLRSLTPSFMPAHDFRDLVLYLSGQLPIERLMQPDRVYAWSWLQKIEADPSQPKAPWFQPTGATPLQFADFAGHEAWYTSDLVQGGKDAARSRAEVFEEGGIYLEQVGAARDRDTVMRKLLSIREDGWPGILIDPSNKLLITALGGGLVWKGPTPTEPQPDTYAKDGVHDNVYEALSYGLVGVVPIQDALAAQAGPVWRDRQLIQQAESAGLGFNEASRSRF
jgi:hypothetical protein